jgi:hypothetical protein
MTTFGKVKKRIEPSPVRLFSTYLVFGFVSNTRWLLAAKVTDGNTGK